ncbi:MAG TPA: BatD family protein [Bryobacteraceae bacterium]|nr:BatD family protein [Bryobacteraceae bacterium]
MIRTLFFALGCSYLLSAAPPPIVRAAVASPRPIIVGQGVRVNVTVLVPNYFLGAPGFPELNVENAIVVQPQETPQNSNETINGQTFAGIGVTYLIYPQQPGTFKLPAAAVTVKYASNPPESTEMRLPLPAVSFEAIIPPQAANLDYFLPTTSFVVTQKFDKALKNLKVGDTITRTVTITGSKLKAMLIPPIKFQVPDGIDVYPKQPMVNDIKNDRGEFVEGKRVDSATYLIRKEGDYTLPAIQIEWWNLAAGKVQTASLPPTRFTAAPNPDYRPELAPEPEPVVTRAVEKTNPFYPLLGKIAGISLIVLILVWLWVRFARWIGRRWRTSRAAYRESEAAHFSRLRKACRARNAKDAYPLFLSWLSRFKPGVSVDRFLLEAADDNLTYQFEALASMLYSRSRAATWSGNHMIEALQHVRSRRSAANFSRHTLPPLNPVGRP